MTGSPQQASRNRREVDTFFAAARISDCSQIVAGIIQDYLLTLQNQGLSPRSIRNKLSGLSSFCRFLTERDILISNPCMKVRRPKILRRPPRYLTLEQIEQCLALAWDLPGDVWLVCYVAIYTGVRLSELRNIEWQDFLWEQKILVIPITKSNRPRAIPLSQHFIRDIKPLAQKMGIIFPGRIYEGTSGKREKHTFIAQLDPIREKMPVFTENTSAKGCGRCYHIMRHSYCSQHVMAGTPIAKVSVWAGHKDISTTMLYAHLAPKHDEDAERF